MKKRRRLRGMAACVALFMLLMFSICGHAGEAERTDAAPVHSIELIVDENGKVAEVIAAGERGRRILGDMQLEGSAADAAMNALIGSMLKYQDEQNLSAAVLVSAQSGDMQSSALLQRQYDSLVTQAITALCGDLIAQPDAENAALAHAGIDRQDAILHEVHLDREKGVLVWEVEFISGGTEYEYELSADSGAILKRETEPAGKDAQAWASSVQDPSAGFSAQESAYIGEAAAQKAAVGHAGVAKDSLSYIKIRLDEDDGHMNYEIKFASGGYAFEYEIDALTGEVTQFEKERTGSAPKSGGGQESASAAKIGTDAAKNAALGHAGVSASDVRGFKCELDRENGREVYEIEFRAGGYEYEYEIDAQTGSVLKSERDRD